MPNKLHSITQYSSIFTFVDARHF